jgi:hypothetical protein
MEPTLVIHFTNIQNARAGETLCGMEQSAAVVTTEHLIDVTCEQCKGLMTPEIDSHGILGARRT